MYQNSTKLLFLFTMTTGVFITLSANSWFSAWMGLEINLLSFIPLLSSSQEMMTNEAALKYFLIQAIASSTLLFLIIIKMNTSEMFHFNDLNLWNNLLLTPLFMKIAAAPFHWWLPAVIEGLTWKNTFIILSIQKIAPLILISYLLINSFFTQTMIILSALIGAIGGFNQNSIRKILSFSSINHIGWMLAALMMGPNFWILYFIVYMINLITLIPMFSFNNLTFITQTFTSLNYMKISKIILFISLLSLGGLPPFLGFFPKWMIIYVLIQNFTIPTCLILIFSSLITLFYYMRIMYTTLMITNAEVNWLIFQPANLYLPSYMLMSLSMTLLGMLICTMILINF
uniref:NADH dehydrogenase subunit 2 n=1 Tax=Theopompa maculosa TaxID=2909580 RepID=UPI003002B841